MFEKRLAPPACPHCGSDVPPTRRKARRLVRKCRVCRHEYSVLHGSPFTHTKAPLGLWAAILTNPAERMSVLCRTFKVDEVTVSAIRKRAAAVPPEWKKRLLSVGSQREAA